MSLSSRKINNINNINSGPSQENNYNTFLLAFVLCAILLGIILIYFSQQFRVSRAIKNMDIYIKFQNIQSMKPSLLKDYKLCDFYVSSSYNSGLSGTQLIDYVTTDTVKKVLQTGARYLEFQIFGDKYGPDAEPIVSSGFKKGEWKMTLNTLYLEDVFKTIRDNAFRVFDGTDGSPNYLDPLFISLDLKTNYNYYVTNKIQKLLSTYLIDYLLDPSFNYQAKNIGTTPLKDLMGKLVIFSSDGFQGSTLEELINYSSVCSNQDQRFKDNCNYTCEDKWSDNSLRNNCNQGIINYSSNCQNGNQRYNNDCKFTCDSKWTDSKLRGYCNYGIAQWCNDDYNFTNPSNFERCSPHIANIEYNEPYNRFKEKCFGEKIL